MPDPCGTIPGSRYRASATIRDNCTAAGVPANGSYREPTGRLGFVPRFLGGQFDVTVGVRNVFNRNPSPCNTCTGPNYDPTTYAVPGQFGYLRIGYKL